MDSPFQTYRSPLMSRYTELEFQELFGERHKFSNWRLLWYIMAQCQRELGVNISQEQVAELGAHVAITDEEIVAASALEKIVKHDVVAHSRTYGQTCPKAAPIIHLACTSMYVCDNTDLMIMRDAIQLLLTKIAKCLDRMAKQAKKWAHQPTLAWTHLQAAQPTTVGKRIALWMQDLEMDYQNLIYVRDSIKFLGAKGATGTQDSYLKLFGGDAQKVAKLDQLIAQKCGFSNMSIVCGQTYTRKIDAMILSALAGVSSTVHKMMLDLRVLQHLKEIEEPFSKSQTGSSAMMYKRNPMLAERADSLARHGMVLSLEPLLTHGLQIFERTLDDSAGRRIYIPEAFLTADAILCIVQNFFENIVVYPKMIDKHLAAEMPFMAAEAIVDAMVKQGKDRTECYERLRVIAQEAGRQVKEEGLENPFMSMVTSDPYFSDVGDIIAAAMDPRNFIGLAPSQTLTFLENAIAPLIAIFPDLELQGKSEIKV